MTDGKRADWVCALCREEHKGSKERLNIETDDFGHQQSTDSEKPRKFWFCWVEGKPGPVKKHLAFFDANVEALRLSQLEGNGNVKVYILESKGYCFTKLPRPPAAVYTEL